MKNCKIRLLRIVFAAAIPVIAAAIILLRDRLVTLKRFLPECPIHKETGYLCPACGNTRCIENLLQGKLLSAIQYNVTIPLLLMIFFAFYMENLLVLFGLDIKIVSRKSKVWWGIGIVVFTYYFLRNVLPLSPA